jgi:transglutaminase superfamily protein
MPSINKLLRLSASDRLLLLKAFLSVCIVRIGLSLLPFRLLRQAIIKFAREPAGTIEERQSVQRIVWAVMTASRYVPTATCLTEALATKLMLIRNGHKATVRLGVSRNQNGQFQAHAWVESDGLIVIGDSQELFRFTRLPSLEGDPL